MLASARRKTLWIFTLLVASGLSARAAEIRLKPVAACRGALVRLSDVADLVGASDDDTRRFGQIELFATPSVGGSRWVRGKEVREVLTLRGVDLTGWRMSGAEAVEIAAARDGQIAPVSLQARFEKAAEQNKLSAVVATRTVVRGETVRKGDVELRAISKFTKGFQYASRLEDVLGREASRQLDPLQPIDLRWLQQPLLVRKNETIAVVSRAAGVQVRTVAKALEDGTQGEYVTVESLDDKKRRRFAVRVVGLQEAEVYAGIASVVSDTPAR